MSGLYEIGAGSYWQHNNKAYIVTRLEYEEHAETTHQPPSNPTLGVMVGITPIRCRVTIHLERADWITEPTCPELPHERPHGLWKWEVAGRTWHIYDYQLQYDLPPLRSHLMLNYAPHTEPDRIIIDLTG